MLQHIGHTPHANIVQEWTPTLFRCGAPTFLAMMLHQGLIQIPVRRCGLAAWQPHTTPLGESVEGLDMLIPCQSIGVLWKTHIVLKIES